MIVKYLSTLQILLVFVASVAMADTKNESTGNLDIDFSITHEPLKKVLIYSLLDEDVIDKSVVVEIMARLKSVSRGSSRFILISDFSFSTEEFRQAADAPFFSVKDQLIEKAGALDIDEILLVTNVDFIQYGVQPETPAHDDEPQKRSDALIFHFINNLFFGSTVSEAEAGYPNNMLSEVSLAISRIDVQSSYVLNNVYINESNVGGNAAKSKKAMMLKLEKKINKTILELYPIRGQSYREKNGYVLIKQGELSGVIAGSLFSIVQPEKKIVLQGVAFPSPGRQIAIARVVDVSEMSSRLKIVRQWRRMGDQSKARELSKQTYSSDFVLEIDFPKENYSVAANLLLKPFSRFHYGSKLTYLHTTDTRRETVQGVSLGPVVELELFRIKRFSVDFQWGIDFNFFFRNDDAGQSVVAANVGSPFFINVAQKISRDLDAVYALGYLVSIKTSNWSYFVNKKDEHGDDTSSSIPASWNGKAPEINLSGWYFKFGLRAYFF